MSKLKKFLYALLAATVLSTAVAPQMSNVTAIYAKDGTSITNLQVKSSELLAYKWDGKAYATVNNNKPTFKKRYLAYKKIYIKAAKLDKYGRPHTVRAVLGPETVNNGNRDSIGQFKPAGWQTVKYADIVDGLYVYNRCHLIGQAISAGKYSSTVNSKLNLVTGTRYMNVDGMEPFENSILYYLRSGKGHVIYQVTPLYKGNELVCRGVWMQAYSLEDKGKSISFNIYCPNIQPGINISYADGSVNVKSNAEEEMMLALKNGAVSVKDISGGTSSENSSETNSKDSISETGKQEYVLNTNTKKFHRPDCKSVKDIKSKNCERGKYNRNALINEGYSSCKNCNP